MDEPLRTLELLGVGAAVVLSAVLFTQAAGDPVNTVKLTAVALSAVLALAAAVAHTVRSRRLALPRGLPAAAAGLLLVALVVAAVASPSTTTAVLGTPGRLSGLLLYASALLLFVSTLRSGFDGLPWVQLAVVAAGTFTASYGLLQYVGWDAVPWANEFNPIIAGLGNPNFASGYLGVCVPVAAAWALRLRPRGPAQVALTSLTLLMLVVALLSQASQGPLAAGAGLAVVALAVSLDLPQRVRRVAVACLAGVVALGVAALAAGTQGAGPLAPLFGPGSFTSRRWYWDAALSMWRDEPLVGVGLDHFGWFWWAARPLENIVAVGGDNYTDAAHSAPLHLLATGGLLVAVPYVLLMALVAVALGRGLVRLRGAERLRLAGVGGAWVAYQVQSLVSIDQVPLVVLNFVLAGAVLLASSGRYVVERDLPGALAPVPERPGKRRAPSLTRRVRVLTPADQVGLGAVAVAALALAWWALLPLRADIALRNGETALAMGNGDVSLREFERATELLPGRSQHWVRLADVLATAQRPAQALAAYDRGIAVAPANLGALRSAARTAEGQGELERARGYHEQALRWDPYNPVTLELAAGFELRHGGAQRARELLEPAVVRTPGAAALWTSLGDARQVLGDRRSAVEAYRRALAITPDARKAAEELAKLES